MVTTASFVATGVAVTVFVALVVVAVYDVVSASNAGVKVNEPIANPDKSKLNLGLQRYPYPCTH